MRPRKRARCAARSASESIPSFARTWSNRSPVVAAARCARSIACPSSTRADRRAAPKESAKEPSGGWIAIGGVLVRSSMIGSKITLRGAHDSTLLKNSLDGAIALRRRSICACRDAANAVAILLRHRAGFGLAARNPWCDDDNEFGLLDDVALFLESIATHRDVSENWDLVRIVRFLVLDEAAERNALAIACNHGGLDPSPPDSRGINVR